MNPTLHAARAGLDRGWIEFRQSITTAQDLTYAVVINGILLTVLFFQRGSTLGDGAFSLAAATLPSLVGMTVAVGGLMGLATALASDREDGTLLRAKATPRGLVGYLVARIVFISLNTVVSVVIVMVGGLLMVDGVAPRGAAGWLTLLWVLGLGLLATLPWGAVIGSLVKSSNSSFGLTFLPISGLAAISGVFYPITCARMSTGTVCANRDGRNPPPGVHPARVEGEPVENGLAGLPAGNGERKRGRPISGAACRRHAGRLSRVIGSAASTAPSSSRAQRMSPRWL